MTPDRLFIATLPNCSAEQARLLAESFAGAYEKQTAEIDLSRFRTAEALAAELEREEAAMLFIERGILPTQRLLNLCRELRIPYVISPPAHRRGAGGMKILVPVTFLPEEREKGAVAAAIARRFSPPAPQKGECEILLMPATDKGSRARRNADALTTLFKTFNLSVREIVARKDSFGVEREALVVAEHEGADLLLVTASRSYSIDDVIFGPKERRIISRATLPVVLLNPRSDLYVLCG